MTPADEETQEPTLTMTGPDGRAQRFFIGIVSFIGKSPECDIALKAPGVSNVHAVLARTPSGLVLRDLFTPSGVQVNGELVRETLLSDGDEVRFGDTRLVVQVPEDANPLGDSQIQQDLIQQMADRLAKLEDRRRALVQKAWNYRRTSRGKGVQPAGGALRLELDQARGEAAKLRAELDAARLRPRSVALPPSLETQNLKAELDAARQQLTKAEALRVENARLEQELQLLSEAASDLQAAGGLKKYQQELDEYREQLGREGEAFAQREADFADRERAQAELIEQLQAKSKQMENDFAAERARLTREQANLERAMADARTELEELYRQADTLERDERLLKLRSHVRTDPHTQEGPAKLSDRINRFLKGLGK